MGQKKMRLAGTIVQCCLIWTGSMFTRTISGGGALPQSAMRRKLPCRERRLQPTHPLRQNRFPTAGLPADEGADGRAAGDWFDKFCGGKTVAVETLCVFPAFVQAKRLHSIREIRIEWRRFPE